MKKLFFILSLVPALAFAQPNKNGVDSVTISGNTLLEWKKGIAKQRGNVAVIDANSNTIIGHNPTIINSVGNLIAADNVQLTRSHNNSVFAKNAILTDVSGCTVSGADHILYQGADYCNVDGDAHNVGGYASRTSGFGNKNFVEYGICEGINCRIGRLGFSNEFSRSSARGWNIIIEGNNSHGIGSNFTIRGDNIIVIGKGSGEVFTVAGVYILGETLTL